MEVKDMKSYGDLDGDGGSQIIEQVLSLKEKVRARLSGIKRMIAIGSGKGGVGKSTITFQLANQLRKYGKAVAILDADFNGPTIAQISGTKNVKFIPGENGLTLPVSKSGIGIFSVGSLTPESEAVNFSSVAQGDSYIWRATKEFSVLTDILANTNWGELDFLLVDLPPGAERCRQFAEFFGKRVSFILITIPSDVSRGVVSRSYESLKESGSDVIGFIENMDGYFCHGCKSVKPLFPNNNKIQLDLQRLGGVPFDPELALKCDRGIADETSEKSPAAQSLAKIATDLLAVL